MKRKKEYKCVPKLTHLRLNIKIVIKGVMMTEAEIKLIEEIVGESHLQTDAPMSEHTTFKIGGPADVLCMPQNKEQILKLLKAFRENDIDYFFMGNGSNLLVSDEGFRGVIVKLLDDFGKVNVAQHGNHLIVNAQAGARMWRLGMTILENNGAGFEFGTGIPGTIGGAVMMNAGAYGGEMKDVVSEASVVTPDGRILELSNSALDFGYRRSAISDKGLIVLDATLELELSEKDEIKARIDELTAKRKLKQPLDVPSAGSTFKRPPGYYAAALIEEAELKGFAIGGACVSEKHAGFVINQGGATAADVVALTDEIKRRVFENSGVKLELEVRKLGF